MILPLFFKILPFEMTLMFGGSGRIPIDLIKNIYLQDWVTLPVLLMKSGNFYGVDCTGQMVRRETPDLQIKYKSQ